MVSEKPHLTYTIQTDACVVTVARHVEILHVCSRLSTCNTDHLIVLFTQSVSQCLYLQFQLSSRPFLALLCATAQQSYCHDVVVRRHRFLGNRQVD